MSLREYDLDSDSFLTGFDDDLRARCIAIIMAAQKHGKTQWAIEGVPGPVIVYNFDQGLEGVIEPLFAKKKIIVAGMPGTAGPGKSKYPHYHFARPPLKSGEKNRKDQVYLDRVRTEATPVWNRFVGDYKEGLESTKVRSLVIDTGGAVYQLGKFAFLGMDRFKNTDDPYGQKSGDLKAIMQGLIADAYSHDKNVIWVHRPKEIWKGGEPSGVYEPEGYKQAAYEVQFTLHLKKTTERKKVKREDGSREYVVETARTLTLVDPRIQLNVPELTTWGDGEEERPSIRFDKVMADIYGNTPMDWR